MSRTHAILSDLHRLLSTYSEEDLVSASKYPGLGTPLRNALLELATEAPAGPLQASNKQRRRDVSRSSEPARFEPTVPHDKSSLIDLILKSEYGASGGSLRNFSAAHGIKLDLGSKDSKSRIAGRLASAVMNLSDSKKNLVLADLLGRVSDQTQGWINVIKGIKQ